MKPERLQKIDEVFESALDITAESRARFLDEACAGDLDLRQEVESLLNADEQAGGFIKDSAADVAARLLVDKQVSAATEQTIGQYRLDGRLGGGGMGQVYLASDKLGRKVALKLLTQRFPGDESGIARFKQEALTLLALNHPNIVTIHDIGQSEGVYYIASELVEGETLRQRLDKADIELHDVLEIVIQIATALAAAHEKGIVHRDIKPENVMIRRDGYVKVLDFGIAKLTGKYAAESEASTIKQVQTAEGTVIGTAPYMSPEQARGLAIDSRTDIWSLGVVMYEAIAGRKPFSGDTTPDMINSVMEKTPAPLIRYAPEVPEALEWIVSRTLRKEKEKRYQTASALLTDLKELKKKIEFAQSASSEGEGGATTLSAGNRRVTSAPPTPTSSAEYVVNELKRHRRGVLMVLIALAIAVGAGAVAYFKYFRSSSQEITSIAVLPFANEGGDQTLEYVSDGLSESLINSLSQLPQLKVIARSSSFQYKGKDVNPEDAARALGVQAILIGRVAQRGNSLVVSAELVDARDGTQVWGERYTRQAADIQGVQEEIARTISGKLHLRLSGPQEEQLAKHATKNTEAYRDYLNGVFYLRKGGPENVKRALEYFNQAIVLDSNFALAWVGVARANRYFSGNSLVEQKEPLARATAATMKALELDERLAEAHVVLAGIKRDEWDWAGAEREYKRAIELNPNLVEAHRWYSGYLSFMERHDEALAENRRAQELDPLDPGLRTQEGWVLCLARRYVEASEKLEQLMKMEPDSSAWRHFSLGLTYEARGMYEQALNEYRIALSINPQETPWVQTIRGYALAKSGKRSEAQAILDRLKTSKEYVSPTELATLYVGLGDKEGAIASLQKAYNAHDLQLQTLKVDPHLDSLRSDPRFQDLIRRVGLP